mmetsp:Transcript_4104/g.7886  ORF Transcript_4104/g.7886 Transcript_4104/m.7886 type:complete len:242 (+) Transcript_4104:80-805(+)
MHGDWVGYRHIDSAIFYDNEAEVGQAIRESKIDRKDIFVTSKLWSDNHGQKEAVKAVENSLKAMQTSYIDLYLIHSPYGGNLVSTYEALLGMKKAGKIRSVGVSNFGVQHLEGLRKAGLPTPSVNQIELHPWLQQGEIVDYCTAHKITVEAYSPLTKGQWLDDEKLGKIAAKHQRSPAQILIRWSLQKGFVVLPKSTNPKRIAENFKLEDFQLDEEDMKVLKGFDADKHCTWDPTRVPWSG